MRLAHLLNLGLIAAGAAASVTTLRRRHQWERANRRAYIVLDYDDVLAVSTRARLPLSEFLRLAREHGATHASLPELTLNRLLAEGRLVVTTPPVGGESGHGLVYLAGSEPQLLEHLASELNARLARPASVTHRHHHAHTHEAPEDHDHTHAHGQPHDHGHRPAHTHLSAESLPPVASLTNDGRLCLAGHLPTLAEMGLGFEAEAAAAIIEAGLGVVPRPVSFAWPEAHLVERTLAQAAGLQAEVVAYDGDVILGHEMHLDATVEGLLRHGLHFAYFCETRHQKGDWFIAKRLAPRGHVVLAHYFTPAALVPEDYHSAAHHWGMLARARGIRLCYVNVFRRIHATEPLECLHYLDHLRGELEGLGLQFDSPAPPPMPAPSRRTLSLVGLGTGGAAALAVSETLNLRGAAALGVTALAAAGAAAVPYLDRPRGALEEAYPPSYAPKLLALAGASAAPAAAVLGGDLAAAALIQAGTAATLAAYTTGRDYALRIEAYRSLNLDAVLPLAAVAFRQLAGHPARWPALAALAGLWYVAQRSGPDVLGEADRDLPAGHTHHLSAAQRLMGDTLIALGPRPARKWAGVGLAGLAAAGLLQRLGRREAAVAAALAASLANAAMLAAFRRPERPLAETLPGLVRSWAAWGPVAVALSVLASVAARALAPNDSA